MTEKSAVSKAIDIICRVPKARVVTVYITPKRVVRVARLTFKGKVQRGPHLDLSVTIGRPNYDARQFIARAKAAGEPFPVRKPQIAYGK